MSKFNNWGGADGVKYFDSKRTKLGLLERHYPVCPCERCIENKHLNRRFNRYTPGLKAWNSWWSYYLKLGKYRYYLRYHSVFYKHTKISSKPTGSTSNAPK